MATYTTDLQTVDLCDGSASLSEFSVWAAGDVNGDGDTDYFIQGTSCHTGAQRSKTGLQSIVIDYGSDLSSSLSSGDCIFMWQVLLAGNAIEDWDNGGYRMGIGSGLSNFWWWRTGGNDFNRNPYGGWQNVAVCPDIQNTAVQIDVNSTNGTFTRASGSFITDGFCKGHVLTSENFSNGGNNSTFYIDTITATVITVTDNTGMVTETGSGDEVLYMCDDINGSPASMDYFGSGVNMASSISKGNLHGLDAIRYGRGEIKATGTSATFSGMAQENDYNDSTNGYNRWGLFQSQSGGYLWKGLMSLGDVSTSVTLSDSDASISIEDTPRTYADFNKIEINHASSSITWTRVNFTAVNGSQLSPGDFEMVANATVDINSCAFTDMGTFLFDSNATIDDSTFLRCGQVTHGGADFNACIFSGYEGDSDSGYLVYNENSDIDGEINGSSFTKGTASTHAIEFGTSAATTHTLRDLTFSGYNASDGNTDSTLYFPDTGSDTTWTINLNNCSSGVTYKKARSGDTVNLVIDPVTTKFTIQDVDLADIQGARVLVETADNGGGTGLPYQASVSTLTQSSGTATLTASADHGLATDDYVTIRGAQPDEYNKTAKITVTGTATFTYSMDSGATSPATGTPVFSYAPISGTTDVNGEISSSKSWPGSQSLTGWVRKSDGSPYYKQTSITISDASGGTDAVIILQKDE